MPSDNQLVETWRAVGPVAWAQSGYGWITETGRPIVLLEWQRAALGAWYENHQRVTTFAISNVKKCGKTACNAVLLAWRWLALPGDHFAVGNDLDQSAGRQFSEIAAMVRRNPYLAKHCIVGKRQIVFQPTGSTITALAVDAAGNAGANHLTASHTEAWGIVYEAGIRAYEELTPPPGEFYGDYPPMRIADSYAGFLGQSDTWHTLVDRGLAGELVSAEWPIYLAGGLLLFHVTGPEAQARCFRGTPEQAERYYSDQRAQLRDAAYRRQHLNERTSNESKFIPDELWAACYSEDVRPVLLSEGGSADYARRLILGADASTSRDLTALVGCVAPGGRLVDHAYTRVWRPERGTLRGGKPTVDLDATIGAEVLALHTAGLVACVLYDPYQLHSVALRWAQAGVRVLELPQNAGRIEADQALYDAIIGRSLRHYGDPTLTEHVANAVAVETPRGHRLAKEKTSLKIDAAVALSMAHYGATRPELRANAADLIAW